MSAEYVDDVPYVRQFIGDLSPARIRLVAAMNGIAPPPADDFDYCELGCAHGDTLAALAAAHPTSRFVGIDLSAAHIASGKKLARDGALENVGFLERDFADVGDEVGELDYIVAHGVFTWISPDKRKALIDFARAKLKPGGLLHVTYNAMPGWSSVEPLRQLLLFGGGTGTSLERAARGLAFAQSMQRVGAEYFKENPAASDMLQTMARAGLPYLVHEYLHDHWAPMYFARVAWEMADRDLHFVGVMPLLLNYRETAIPEALERHLATVTDRLTFESLKDFAIDEFFRRDVYAKGKITRSADATTAYLDETVWGTLDGAPADRLVRLPHRTVSLEGPTFDALFAALHAGAATLSVLSERTGLAVDLLRPAMTNLLLAERAVPITVPTRAVASSADDRFTVPSPYNQMMLRRLGTDVPVILTSPRTGVALTVAALEGLAIRVVTEAAAPDRDRWIRDLVGRSVLRLRVGDQVIDDPEAQRAAIATAVASLHAQRLPKLLELGILTRA